MSAIPFHRFSPRVRLPVRAALRLGPVGDIWHKPALSAVAASAVVLLALLLAGRLDLTLYASAGAMCALYGHALPYAARARTLGWVVIGMLAGTTAALVTAALTDSVAVRVAVAAVLAGLHKAACDATRIGPPGNVVLTFIAASAAFVPHQRLADLPLHVGVGVLGGIVAWAVGMAPRLLRPDGPERVAVARALEATARLLRAHDDGAAHQARHASATAVNAAWQTLLRSGERREGLRRLLVRAESAAAHAGGRGPGGPVADPGALLTWAHDLRRGRPVPEPPIGDARTEAAERAELAGITAEQPEPTRATGAIGVTGATGVAGAGDPVGRAGSIARTRAAGAARMGREGDSVGRDGSIARGAVTGCGRWAGVGRRLVGLVVRWWRVVAMVSGGAALAGWASMAFGVGRPYWAVVTAAAVFAANTTMSWSRALQRVVGNLLGVAVFTLVVPLTRLGAIALIVAVLVMQFVTEAVITRNYWLGSVFVAPMAMLMTEFAGAEPVSALVADRWLDTCLGAAAGLLACVLLPDRSAARRVRAGLERLERLVEQPLTEGRAARDRLRAALVELREAADIAAGEWWSAALPQERIAAAERAGHHRLAELTTT